MYGITSVSEKNYANGETEKRAACKGAFEAAAAWGSLPRPLTAADDRCGWGPV